MHRIFVAIAVWSISISALANQSRLLVWQPSPKAPRILIFANVDQSDRQAIASYVEKVNHESQLDSLRKTPQLRPDAGTVHQLNALRDSGRPQITLVGNRFPDFFARPIGTRVMGIVDQLSAFGGDVYVLPLAHDIGLSPESAKEYRRLVANSTHGLLALGGSDLHPRVYEEQITHAVDFNLFRDQSELRLIKQFMEAHEGQHTNTGALFGICRGHQLCSVAKGKKLIQDIYIETKANPVHRDQWHLVNLKEGSILQRLLGKSQISVRSFHHQAVSHEGGRGVMVVGESVGDKVPIIEAVEFDSLAGFTVQFHPELMNTRDGKAMMLAMVQLADGIRKENTLSSQLFESLRAPRNCLGLGGRFQIHSGL